MGIAGTFDITMVIQVLIMVFPKSHAARSKQKERSNMAERV